MNKNEKIILVVAGVLTLILVSMKASYINILTKFMATWESFSDHPYWDVSQWSWGYGTRVPGSTGDKTLNPGGTITRDQALLQAVQHINTDFNYLKTLIKIPLSANQWAAYLSFSYNLGPYDADNLTANINAMNWAALETQWKKYIYADGVISTDLIRRRNAEWELFSS